MKEDNKIKFLLKIAASLFLTVWLPLIALAEPPTVTWVYMDKAEPINWKENGVAKGMEVEIVEHVLGKLGIKVKHKFYPWSRAQIMVEKGKADAMMTTPTAKRFQYAVFGKENVLPNYWNLFIQKGNVKMEAAIANMTQLEDLKPYKLVDFIGNGWTAAFMKGPGGYTINEVPKLEQIPRILAQGRHDLAINSSTWINWWASKTGVQEKIQEFEIDWPWTRFHFVFMVSRKSPWVEKGLIRALDEEAKKMKESGVWHEILKKYKNPHGSGTPFVSFLDKAYEEKQGFYKTYEQYPIYSP